MRAPLAILLILFTTALSARAAVTPVPTALFDEILSRVEMMNNMGFAAETILNNAESQISGRARALIMTYGATADQAVQEFLRVELARRQSQSNMADLARAQRAFDDCLYEDQRFASYKWAVDTFAGNPRGRFDAVTAVADLPVDTRDFRACLTLLPDVLTASSRAGQPSLGKAYWCILSETKLALRQRDLELDNHPLRRTLERTRDAARGMYYRFKDPFKN